MDTYQTNKLNRDETLTLVRNAFWYAADKCKGKKADILRAMGYAILKADENTNEFPDCFDWQAQLTHTLVVAITNQ